METKKDGTIKRIVRMMWKELLDPYYRGVAGQLAFFLFLSVLPLLALFSQILGIFSLSLDTVREWANIRLSQTGFEALTNLLSEGVSTGGNIILLLVTIWAASRAQFALSAVTDYINNDGERIGGNYFKRRFRSYILILLVLLVFVIALALLVYAPLLIKIIIGKNSVPPFFSALWKGVRWVIVAALYFATTSLIYYVTPYHRVPYQDILPGTIFSCVGFIIVTVLYTLFTGYNRSNNILYGSMANVVILLIWFWCMSWVILLGIVLNKVMRRIRETKEQQNG